MPSEPTQLFKLLIEEVSGVSEPANLTDGWMVIKSRGEWRALLESRVRAYLARENAEYVQLRKAVEGNPRLGAAFMAECVEALRENGVEPLYFDGVKKARVLYRSPETGRFVSASEAEAEAWRDGGEVRPEREGEDILWPWRHSGGVLPQLGQ